MPTHTKQPRHTKHHTTRRSTQQPARQAQRRSVWVLRMAVRSLWRELLHDQPKTSDSPRSY